MRSCISHLHARSIYWRGKKIPVGVSENSLRVENFKASSRELKLYKHTLFLPFTLFAGDHSPRIDGFAHFEPKLDMEDCSSFEIFGNAIAGKKSGIHFSIHEGIFHRPHFLPKLWRAMMGKGIFFVHAILPENSPYATCFGSRSTYGAISLLAPQEMELQFFGVSP